MSTFNSYDLGSAVILTGAFADISGNATAPTNVRLRVEDPTATETVYTSFSNPSLGVYSYTLICLTAGVWRYRWEGDGAVTAVADAAFVVTSTAFADAQP